MASAAPGMAASHPYTCNTCMVAFKNSELQRGHMQSDWHRYNLKRRVASLPPLSSDVFTEKVLANQATAAATAAKASFERLCGPCQKTYFSENAFRNHLNSQKHKTRVAMQAASVASHTEDETNSVMSSVFSLGETDTTVDARPAVVEDDVADEEFSHVVNGIKHASLADDAPVPRRPGAPTPTTSQREIVHPLSPSEDDQDSDDDEDADGDGDDDEASSQQCLFCNSQADSMLTNVKHMKAKHGLFIPEQSYLVDPQGLLVWLHGRVHSLHECLYCGIIKHTTSGIQTHMRDKGHCMIAFDSEEQMVEVGQFYDFRATYSDDESDSDSESDEPKPNASHLGAKRPSNAAEDDAEDGEGWETDDSQDDAPDAAVKPKKQRAKKSAAAEQVYFDEDGLHLPSGRTAGHRSLAKYFRQNLHNYPSAEERTARQAMITNGDEPTAESDAANTERSLTYIQPKVHKSKAVTRANGGLGMLGVSDATRRAASSLEKADRKRMQRQQSRYQWGNDKRGNNQQHFRDPLLQ